jgi:hypothetical protein
MEYLLKTWSDDELKAKELSLKQKMHDVKTKLNSILLEKDKLQRSLSSLKREMELVDELKKRNEVNQDLSSSSSLHFDNLLNSMKVNYESTLEL